MPGHTDGTDTTIDIGRLRQRVTLMQPSSAADASGTPLGSTEFATRWASIDTLTGSELYRSQQFTSEANRLVVMRWLDGVLPSMTLKFGSREFQILYVDNVQERQIKLILYCKEVLS